MAFLKLMAAIYISAVLGGLIYFLAGSLIIEYEDVWQQATMRIFLVWMMTLILFRRLRRSTMKWYALSIIVLSTVISTLSLFYLPPLIILTPIELSGFAALGLASGSVVALSYWIFQVYVFPQRI